MGSKAYYLRAAARLKALDIASGEIVLTLIVDHGCRIYSEQRFTLLGVLPNHQKAELIGPFVENWILQAAEPSTLWIKSLEPEAFGGWLAEISRVALSEFSKPTDHSHDLSADLVEQGLAYWVD